MPNAISPETTHRQHAYLNDVGLICALGSGKAEVLAALRSGTAAGMRQDTRYSPGARQLFTGQVTADLPDISYAPREFRSRNNQLLLAALAQIRGQVDAVSRRFGPARVAVVVGTTTSGIGEGEAAFLARTPEGALPQSFHYAQMEIGSPSEFLSHELGLSGVAFTVSTACSSSAKALLSAKRLLHLNVCDAVIAGGSDALCKFTNAGFLALDALSTAVSRPFQDDRDGINIGEGAALFLVTREACGPTLAGAETSDAHHISAPHPDGLGAALAMRRALADAELEPHQVDFLNAHGTGTPHNDSMERLAIQAVLGPEVRYASTKPLSGHTLGAAGALEAAFCWLLLCAQPNDGLNVLMSNSFGFGGSNASLVLTRRQPA